MAHDRIADRIFGRVALAGIALGELGCLAGFVVFAAFNILPPLNLIFCLWLSGVTGGALGLFLEADRAGRLCLRSRRQVVPRGGLCPSAGPETRR